MAIHLRCTATFPHSTGLPEDAVVNTWSLSAGDVIGRNAAADAWTTGLNTFYAAIKANLSSQYAWNSGVYEYVDMADGKPRIPFRTGAAALGALATASFDAPAETAVCISFQGSRASGLNMKRRRGRVYIGPLQVSNVDNPTMSTGVVDAYATAAVALKSVPNVTWCIYSPYTHHDVPVGERLSDAYPEVPGLLDDSFVPVETVWVDNAWDVQRRRGPKATYRKTL